MNTKLVIDQLSVNYGVREVLNCINLEVNVGEIVCVLGHNGAGKTTLLNTIFGLVKAKNGNIAWRDESLLKIPAEKRGRLGMALLPEGQGIFPDLTVEENIELGAITGQLGKRDAKAESRQNFNIMLSIFPDVKKFLRRKAGQLSGGQRQMVSLCRALVSDPDCLLLDEPSIGLAPRLIYDLLEPLVSQQENRPRAIILVEQNIRAALYFSDRVIIINSGQVVASGKPEQFNNAQVLRKYY